MTREAAAKSIVLLKNNRNLLPINKDIGSIFVCGPTATHAQALENYVSTVKILNLQQDLKYRNDRDMKLLGDMQWK